MRIYEPTFKKDPIIQDFLDMGFKRIVEWELRNGKIKLKSLDWQESSGWLYAFAVGGKVKYLGLTTRVLRSRMDDYSYITEEQCAHKRKLIMTEVGASAQVWVYGKQIADEIQLCAEESRLRSEYYLEWNRI